MEQRLSLGNETPSDPGLELGNQLRQMIQEGMKAGRRVHWAAEGYFYVVGGFFAAGGLYLVLHGVPEWLKLHLQERHLYFAVFLHFAYLTGLYYCFDSTRIKRYGEVAEALIRLEDIRAVGPLTDTFQLSYERYRLTSLATVFHADFTGYEALHDTAKEALGRLLPRLRPEDHALLDAEQRAELCRHLNKPLPRSAVNARAPMQAAYRREMAFRIGILRAFAQIGDSKALPTVKKLAQSKPKTAEQRRIQAEAQECLCLLSLRLEQQHGNQTLLRASSAPETGAETLLRAAATTQSAQQTSPSQLLRPGSPRL